MKLVDVKLPKQKKSNTGSEPVEAERDRWPYGLRLTFESEQVDKLPLLEKVKIGEILDVSGIGEVTSIRMNESKEGKKQYSVEVQIQKIGVEGEDKKQSSMSDDIENIKKSRTMRMNED